MDATELGPGDGDHLRVVAFSFIVHEPSEIIEVVSERSLLSRLGAGSAADRVRCE
jgi:hypothetical protein